MKRYLVEVYEPSSNRWMGVGVVKARTAMGAVAQVAKDARHFPTASGIRATEQ